MTTETKPGLFGQKYSSRDYTNPYCWGKNQFNSSFPASLVAYMHSKGIDPVYITTNAEYKIKLKRISGDKLFKIDPLSDNAFYNFEAGFAKFEKYYYIDPEDSNRENIDLVMVNRENSHSLVGLEIKLTALPDNTTKDNDEEQFGCEIVVRPPTLCYLACGICEAYGNNAGKEKLRSYLNRVPKIYHWNEPNESSLTTS